MESLTAVKNAARKGSIPAMETLAFHPERGATLAQILPVVLHHLSYLDLQEADGSTEHPSAKVRLIYLSLAALANRPGVELSRFCKLEWSRVWTWVVFFLEGWVEQEVVTPEGLDFKEKVWTTSTLLLYNLVSRTEFDDEFRTLMGSKREFISLVTSMWLFAAESGHTSKLYASAILERILPASDAAWREQCINAMGDPRHDAAALLIGDILQESSKSEMDSASLRGTLFLIIRATLDSPRLFRAFLAKRSMSWLSFAMARLTSHKQSSALTNFDELHIRTGCLLTCSLYILHCFEEGLTWIVEALKGRLIISLFKSRRFILHDSTTHAPGFQTRLKDSYADLLNRITQYMVYRSVRHEVNRSIKTIDRLGLEEHLEKSGVLWDAWVVLRNEAKLRSETHTTIKMITGGMNFCENEECPSHQTLDLSYRNMICSKCRSALYCSPRCQKIVYNFKHREFCEITAAARLVGYPEPPLYNDQLYIQSLIDVDVHRLRERISALKQKYTTAYPNETSPLVLELDYEVTPLKLKVAPARNYRRAKGVRDWAGVVECAKSDQVVLVYAKMLSCHGNAEYESAAPPLRFFRAVEQHVDLVRLLRST